MKTIQIRLEECSAFVMNAQKSLKSRLFLFLPTELKKLKYNMI